MKSNTNTANLIRFTPLTKIQREINLLKLKRMEAEKAGKTSLVKELQFKIENFAKGMTKDGTQLYSEGGFVKGATLMIITPDGKITASPGKYELDTGEVIEAGEEGIIISVSDPVKQMVKNFNTLKEMKGPNMIERIQRKALSKAKFATVKKFIPHPSKPIA